MSSYGADFLQKKPSVTATEKIIDSEALTSPLQDAVNRFTDSVNLMLEYFGAWLKKESGTSGTVFVRNEFDDADPGEAGLRELGAARQRRDVSRPKYLNELHRRGILSDDFDFDENDTELEDETMSFPGIAGTDLDPAGGNTPPGDDPEEEEESDPAKEDN